MPLHDKYKTPENCEFLCVPRVNAKMNKNRYVSFYVAFVICQIQGFVRVYDSSHTSGKKIARVNEP